MDPIKHAVLSPAGTAIKTGVVDYTYKVDTVGFPVTALPVNDNAVLYYGEASRDEGAAFNADATALVEAFGYQIFGNALLVGTVLGNDADLPEGVLNV